MEDKSDELKSQFKEIIRQNLPEKTFSLFEAKLTEVVETGAKMKFSLLFSGIPRMVGREVVEVSDAAGEELNVLRNGLSLHGWTIDRLCRVCVLLHLDAAAGKEEYLARVEELFSVAEVQEQVALYSALPLYNYPESFRFRTTEGIRTNMTDVFDAVALDNPYPFDYLDEAAWNQMVLKALFMQRPIYRIYGIDRRGNSALARILSDYAHERWAAGRVVSPELWRCFGRFIDERLFEDIERLLAGNDPFREEAAALACHDSDFPAAKEALAARPALQEKIAAGRLTWDSLGLDFNKTA